MYVNYNVTLQHFTERAWLSGYCKECWKSASFLIDRHVQTKAITAEL